VKFTPEIAAELGRRGGQSRSPAKRRAARRNGGSRRRGHPLFSSRSEEWTTPAALYADLDREFGFTLDPCCTVETARCLTYYTRADDGLRKPWGGHAVFMNPPYGRAIGAWVEKAAREAAAGALVVGLLPARTDTAWWHRWVMGAEFRLLPGRLRFGGARHSAPFPSAVVVFRPPGSVAGR
jgi:phage N-6-adenine-methyltransferase